jgi:hypothetical protein
MRFHVEFPARKISNNALIYRAQEFSFDVVPSQSGVTSILVNDLNLEVDETDQVRSIWGICPFHLWKSTELSPPNAQFGDVTVLSEAPLLPGVSVQLNKNHAWPTYVDTISGWVFVGSTERQVQSAKILSGFILSFDPLEELSGIWLKPTRLPV